MLIKDAEIELYENAVMDGEQPPPYEDPECDVYLWWPSSATPYLLLSEHLVEDVDEPQYPTQYALDEDVEAGQRDLELGSRASSPTFSFDDAFVFPERDTAYGLDVVGYSRFFASGLISKSRQITGRLDEVLGDWRRFFKISYWVNHSA